MSEFATDAVAFGAHPDDVELFCGGTVIRLAEGLAEAMDEVASGRGLMGDHHFSVAVHVDRHEGLPGAARK